MSGVDKVEVDKLEDSHCVTSVVDNYNFKDNIFCSNEIQGLKVRGGSNFQLQPKRILPM